MVSWGDATSGVLNPAMHKQMHRARVKVRCKYCTGFSVDALKYSAAEILPGVR